MKSVPNAQLETPNAEFGLCGGLTARKKNSMLTAVSAQEIIEQIKALPAGERAQVTKFVVENDDSWIPESFQQGMDDAEAGRLVDLGTALNRPLEADQ